MACYCIKVGIGAFVVFISMMLLLDWPYMGHGVLYCFVKHTPLNWLAVYLRLDLHLTSSTQNATFKLWTSDELISKTVRVNAVI